MSDFRMPDFRVEHWVTFLVVGMMAAFFVGYIRRRHGYGWLGNLVIGVIGALLGPFICNFIPDRYDVLGGLPSISLGDLVKAMIGAFVLLLLVSFIKERK